MEQAAHSRRLLATAAAALLAVLLAFHAIFGANGMLAYERKRAEYHRLQEETDRLQRENQRISQRIRDLKSDPRSIEREAREQLRYARPGDVVFAVPDPPFPSSNSSARKH